MPIAAILIACAACLLAMVVMLRPPRREVRAGRYGGTRRRPF